MHKKHKCYQHKLVIYVLTKIIVILCHESYTRLDSRHTIHYAYIFNLHRKLAKSQ